MKPAKIEDDTPHHLGHRDRLRHRFMTGGPEALADYELLELLLFQAIPRRDVKPLAKILLAKFGGFAGVINAPVEHLIQIDGISENTAIALKSVRAVAHKLLREELQDKPVLQNWDDLLGYCRAVMAHERQEQFRILFLNNKNRLIADEVQQKGTVNHTPVYPREVVKRALELGATALILVHNHPSDDPKPSRDDINMTQNIIAAATPLGITIHDHVIIARAGHVSMREAGVL